MRHQQKRPAAGSSPTAAGPKGESSGGAAAAAPAGYWAHYGIHLKRAGGGEAAEPAAHFQRATAEGGSEVPYRRDMEASFGADFSSVRAHLGRRDEMAALSAHAATDGRSVAFASTSPDRHTVAHELAHVLQKRQGGGGAAVRQKAVSAPGDAHELEADRVADQVMRREPVAVREPLSGPLHRTPTVGWSSQRTWNDREHTVGATGATDAGAATDWRRIPLDGVTGIRTGRVIAVVPPSSLLAGVVSLDVLLYFHGHGGGHYEKSNGGGTQRTNDLHVSQVPQQMAAAGRPMIGIIAQLADSAGHGGGSPDHDDSRRDIDTPALVRDVFDKLRGDRILQPTQQSGRLIFSGHSAGGRTAVGEAGDHAATSPTEPGGLFLFDGHTDHSSLVTLLTGRLQFDRSQMVGRTPAEQTTYVTARGFVFRYYGSGRGYATRRPTGGSARGENYRDNYGGRAQRISDWLDEWFAGTTNTAGVDSSVLPRWRQNYRGTADAGSSHDAMPSTGHEPAGGWSTSYTPGSGHLEDAMGGLHRKAAGDAGASALERQADAIADAVAAGQSVAHLTSSLHGSAAPAIQRKPDEAQGEAPPTGAPDPQKEYDSLTFKGAIEGGFAGFKKVRDRLISQFGTLTRANAYYAEVRNVAFLGSTPMVHKTTLGPRLAQAERLMTEKGWLAAIVATSPVAGGFNIRENRNDASRLSDHSFGWAVDIDAARNPNIKKFPAAAVKALTGEGMFAGEANTAMLVGGTADQLLPWAQKLRQASEDFKAAFTDEARLKEEMVKYLTSKLGMAIDGKSFDLELVKTAKEKGGKKPKQDFAKLVDLLAGAHPDLAKARAEQGDEEMEATIEESGWKGWAAKKKRAEQATAKANDRSWDQRVREEKKRRQKAGEGAMSLWTMWPLALQELAARMEREQTEVAKRAARLLIEMYGIYKQSFANHKTGERKAPQTVGTPGSIAAQGFINLQSQLIAALTGSDGGDLDWLGNTTGTKDFMHFQLKSGDRPSLK